MHNAHAIFSCVAYYIYCLPILMDFFTCEEWPFFNAFIYLLSKNLFLFCLFSTNGNLRMMLCVISWTVKIKFEADSKLIVSSNSRYQCLVYLHQKCPQDISEDGPQVGRLI